MPSRFQAETAPNPGAAVEPPRGGGAARRLRAGGLAVVGLVTYASVLASGAVRCPVAATLHVPCPTCGATRTSLALLRGDLHGALLNPAAPLLALLVGALGARLVFVAARDGDTRRFDEGRLVTRLASALLVTFAAAVALWIARFWGWFGGPVPV